MRIPITPQRLISSPFSFHCALKLFLALLAAAVLFETQAFAAQTPAAAPAPATTHKTHHTRPAAAHPAAQPTVTPVKPNVPEPPHWPANDQPAPASIVWDSHGLRIDAANSSLQQILKDVSTATGTKVEGLGSDERVFGTYGPGLARDVLSQLLQGSGYNVLMIGDQGQGAPRQLVLASRNPAEAASANKSTAANSDEDSDDADDQPQQPPAPTPSPMRPGFGPGGPPRNPQQLMQDMQQRQQQLQQHTPPQ